MVYPSHHFSSPKHPKNIPLMRAGGIEGIKLMNGLSRRNKIKKPNKKVNKKKQKTKKINERIKDTKQKKYSKCSVILYSLPIQVTN